MVAVLDEADVFEDLKPEADEFVKNVKSTTKPVSSALGDLKVQKDKKGKVDYTQGITELLSIPAGVLASVGAVTKNKAYSCDALAVMIHTPAMAEAVNNIAQEDERVAAVLNKILKTGPYAALVGALVPLAMQIAANHDKIPVVPSMGVLTKEELMAKVAS